MGAKTLDDNNLVNERCSLCGTIIDFEICIITGNSGEYRYCSDQCKETDKMIDSEDYYKDIQKDKEI